jgi:AGZA family xanthine/uracil permease-like MFS transporter
VFGFPEDLVYRRMFPGTALGVMFGDLVYTWMAFRLAKKEGRSDVTAMPLGLDAPSTIGMAFTVLGPAYLAAKARMPEHEAAISAWQVGMACMILIGLFKVGMSFVGAPSSARCRARACSDRWPGSASRSWACCSSATSCSSPWWG